MPGSWLRGLAFERRWLVALFELLIPAEADPRFRLGAKDAPMHRYVDELLRLAPLKFVLGLRASVWLLQLSPLVLLLRPTLLLALRPSEQYGVLDRLRGSEVYLLRELPLLLKTIGCLGFCGLPEVQAQLGIQPRDATPPAWAAAHGEQGRS